MPETPEAAPEEPKEPTETEKLDHLVEKSNRILFQAEAMRPYQVVPDRITIDQTKVTVEYRNFLQAAEIKTILLGDIATVEVVTMMFFASLVINGPNTCNIPFLHKNDALRAKQLITGLQIAQKEDINLDEIPTEELPNKLIEIGTANVD